MGERAGADVRDGDGLPPNASAIEVARRHGFLVEVTEQLRAPLKGIIDFEEMLIGVRPQATAEATDYVVGHELGHHALLNALEGSDLEVAVQRASAAMKMPADAFQESVRQFGRNPYALQSYWRHCSLTAIAFRHSDLEPDLVVSIFVGGTRTRCRWSEGARPPLFLEQLELEARSEAFVARTGVAVVEGFGCRTEAWRTRRFPMCAITVTELGSG